MDTHNVELAIWTSAVTLRDLESDQTRMDAEGDGLQNMAGDQLAPYWNSLLVERGPGP